MNLSAAALQLVLGRLPGWRSARLNAVLCATAAGYNLLGVVLYTPGLGDFAYLGAARATYAVASLHGLAWLVYGFSKDLTPRGLTRTARWLFGLGAGLAAWFAATGQHLQPPVSIVEIRWAGVSYHYPLTTLAGDLYGLLHPVLLAFVFVRLARRFRIGERFLRSQLIGFGLFSASVIDEVLVANRMIEFLSLADLGFVCIVLPLSLETVRRILAESRQIEELSGRLRVERDTAQHALVEAEGQVRDLVSSLQVILWEADGATLRLLYVSEGVEALLGYRARQWRDTPGFWAAHLHPDDREGALAAERQAVASCQPAASEYRMEAADGRWVWFRDFMHPLIGPDGRTARLRGIMVDITESRRAVEAVRESEARYRTLFECANDGVVLLRDGVIVAVNPKAREIWQRPESDILGRRPEDLSPPQQAGGAESSAHAAEMIRAAQGGRPQRFRWVSSAPDGAAVTIEVSLTRLTLNGETMLLAIMHDISGQLRLEEELRQAQKMEAVGRLAGGVAHDFNNLLTVINGYGDLLLRRMAPQDALREKVAQIRAAGERAASLTQQLLAFSRKQISRPRPLSLNAIVGESTAMLRRLLGEDIELVTRLEPGLGLVIADSGQLHQVLMNLAANARDAMPNGGRLLIETGETHLAGDDAANPEISAGPHVVLSVTDSGQGMDTSVRQQIFDPFFTTKETGKGTGLGLSIVYGIVRQHRGSIAVESEPGRGTTFRICLPRADATSSDHPRPEPKAGLPAGSETVLLVEDQEPVRRFAIEVLAGCGYRVLEAAEGGQALRLVKDHSGTIHLMVTDVVMPGMNGMDLAAAVSQLQPHIRVLYISGYAASVIAQRGGPDPEMAYIAKPFTPEALASKVRELLDQPAQPVR